MLYNLGLSLFAAFIIGLIVLDVAMIVSLVRSGDERRQLMVWKASTFTLIGTVGVMVIDVIQQIVAPASITPPFTQLGATATIYCLSLFYYKRKLGG